MGWALAAPAQSATDTARASADAKANPPLALRAASGHLTLPAYGQRVYLNLGVYLVAGDGSFEIRAHRSPDYVGPITAEMSVAGGSFTDLPDGLITNFRGLTDFLRITVRDDDGKIAYRDLRRFCPGYGAVRVRPGAPDTSPYPSDCPYNPFTLGAVYGIEGGFGVPAADQYGRGVKLDRGHYTATLTVTQPWRGLIGMASEDSTVTVNFRVVKSSDCVYGGGPVPMPGRGCRLARHSSQALGKISTQPGRRPAGPGMKADPDPGTLPDLQTLPAYGIRLSKQGFLDFAATEWDAGPAAMVIDGFRKPSARVMASYQYFYNSDGTPAGHKRIGKMEWDPRPGHEHWHFEDFARYSLLDASQTEVVRSRKAGFCLANTDAVDFTVPGAVWNPYNTDLTTACGDLTALAVREVLLTGSGDTYYQSKPGQSFNVKDLPNGVYYVQIEVNPDLHMWEADTTNNISLRKIKLMGSAAHRTVKVFPVGDIDYN
jgi:hypothetical protein